ncbi:hypothetical protein D7X74_19345 [Corallococcus sp. CA047B]|uniref:hypothetical protein n=1 Tax=Corallococcus sp. CA047B TaxID=2316729 RepID=UPI000EA373C7|nr:hypothetical protein [Corallococcus sp. CA047B]RKH14902.1 hypothetical protein D7X74_19345 [Corallococcus sp. CA047B]
MKPRLLLLLGVGVLASSACSQGGAPASNEGAPPTQARSAVAAEPKEAGAKLKFKDGDDRERFSLKPKDDGAKLVDGEDRELARYKWKGGELKVSGPDDAVLAYVTGGPDVFQVKDGAHGAVRYTFAREGSGWKLTDAQGAVLNTVASEDGGASVRGASGAEALRVKVRDGKLSLRDPSGKTMLATKTPVSPEAAACLGFDSLDLPLRMALLFRLQNPAGAASP